MLQLQWSVMNAVTNEDADPGATATVPLQRPAPRPATAETGFLLRLAHVRATEQIAAALPAGLLPRHHEVLAALAEFGPGSQQQLAAAAGDQPHDHGLADRLNGAGRTGRAKPRSSRPALLRIAPTAKGGRALAEMERAADRANALLTASLADREQRPAQRLLRTIASTDGGLDQRPAALTRRTIDLLSLAHHCVSQTFAQRLKHVGLTPPLYGTLRTLDASGPTSQQAIAGQLGLSGTAILQTVDRLEADQLVSANATPPTVAPTHFSSPHADATPCQSVETALDALNTELDNAVGGPRQQQQLRRLLLKLLADRTPPA